MAVERASKEEIEKTPANKMNYSRIIGYGLAALCTVYVIYYFINNCINMATNFIIFLFFTLCAWLYPSPMELSKAIAGNIGSIPQTIVQFPMYGAIMGMMSSSGLSSMIADAIASIAESVPGMEIMKPSKPLPFSSTSSRFEKNCPGLVVCRRQFRLLEISSRMPANCFLPLHGVSVYTAMTL